MQIYCPSCQKTLKVPDHLQGKAVKCPACAATFTAAGTSESLPEPPPLPKDDSPLSRPAMRQPVDQGADEYEEEYDDRPRRKTRRIRRDSEPHRGGMILTFGIIGVVGTMLCFLAGVFAPIAWIMGNGDLRKIRQGNMDPEGEGLTRAGQILGIIGTILFGLYALLICLYFVFFAAVFGAAVNQQNFGPPGGPGPINKPPFNRNR